MYLDLESVPDYAESEDPFTLIIPSSVEDKIFTATNYVESEIAWFGVVKELRPLEFFLEDILIFPQTVTGVTVETDEAEFAKWMANLSDDEYSKLKFHCHSHVKMSTTPSATDQKYYKSQIENMDNDDYKIFMIVNQWLQYDAVLVDKKHKIYYPDCKYEIHIGSDSTIGQIYKYVKEAPAEKEKEKVNEPA